MALPIDMTGKAALVTGAASGLGRATAIRLSEAGAMLCLVDVNAAGLDERARRWITLVGVANSAAEIPIKSHFHAGMASGNCTREEMLEFSLQYGVHAGWPRASLVNGVIMAMAEKVAAGLPWHG